MIKRVVHRETRGKSLTLHSRSKRARYGDLQATAAKNESTVYLGLCDSYKDAWVCTTHARTHTHYNNTR